MTCQSTYVPPPQPSLSEERNEARLQDQQVQLDLIVGQDDEQGPSGEYESAHMLEHMLGTFTSRQNPDGLANETAFEERGIVSNASVDEQTSKYWLRGTFFYILPTLYG